MIKHIKFKESTIAYKLTGEGETVVLVHGFGEDASVWETLTHNVPNYKYLVVSLPGTGESELLNSNASLMDFAAAIKQMLQEEKVETCCMLGHSMGGYVTLAFAEKYTAVLKGIGLIHSSAPADDEEKKEKRKKAIEFVQHNGAAAYFKTMIPDLFVEAKKNQSVIQKQIDTATAFTADATVNYLNAMMQRPERKNVLASATVPVLFILGEHDKTIPLALGLEQASLAAETHVHILKNSAHMGMLEEPDEFNTLVREFLERVFK